MGFSTWEKLTAICLISSTVPQATALVAAITAAQNVGLLRRDTCAGNDNFFQCGSGLPSSFCCAQNTICISLNNVGTQAAICCPNGKDCNQIQPITCNASQQDATKFPTLPFHMVDTSLQLPKCGDNCCPLGYTCDGAVCKIQDSTKAAQSSSASSLTSSTATSSAASSSTSASTSTFTLSTSSTSSASSTLSASKPTVSSDAATSLIQPTSDAGVTGTGFAAGFIPGIILGVLACLGIIWFLRRRSARQNRASNYSFGQSQPAPKISEPIGQPQMATRTDFLGHGRSASVDQTGYNGGGFRPANPSNSSPATVVSAQLGGGSFTSFSPSSGAQRPPRPETGSTATLMDMPGLRNHMGAEFTPTPAPRRKSIPGQYAGLSLDNEYSTSGGLGKTGAPARNIMANNMHDDHTIRRVRGTPTLGKGSNGTNTYNRDSSTGSHRRNSSSGETIEISMGRDEQPLRAPRQSSYYPPHAHDPSFLGSGPRYTIATRHPDDRDDYTEIDEDSDNDLRRQTTYSDVMRAVGARQSQFGTPRSPPPPMPGMPNLEGAMVQSRLGSPWKPLKTNGRPH